MADRGDVSDEDQDIDIESDVGNTLITWRMRYFTVLCCNSLSEADMVAPPDTALTSAAVSEFCAT